MGQIDGGSLGPALSDVGICETVRQTEMPSHVSGCGSEISFQRAPVGLQGKTLDVFAHYSRLSV
jgi:hypothetical protein